MLIHSVYFWLKRGATPAKRTRLLRAVRKLGGIPSVKRIHAGPPADLAERDVTERSFDVALTIVFKDAAGHDAYQVHPIHVAFVKGNRMLWGKVQVFDSKV